MDWRFKIMRTHHHRFKLLQKSHQVPKTLDIFEITLPGTNQFVPLRMDGWKSIVSFWDGATCQVRSVSFRVGTWFKSESIFCQLAESPTPSASYHLLHMRCWPAKLRGSLPCARGHTWELQENWLVSIIWMYMMYTPKPQVMLNFEKWSTFMSFPKGKKKTPITLQFWTSTNPSVDIFFSTICIKILSKKWIGLHSLKLTKTPLKNGWLGNYLPGVFWSIFQRRAFRSLG